jgi:hypothetical protein
MTGENILLKIRKMISSASGAMVKNTKLEI